MSSSTSTAEPAPSSVSAREARRLETRARLFDAAVAEIGRSGLAGADVSTARGAAIRDFWAKYFAAAGTRVSADNYRNMISDPSEVSCPASMEPDGTS